MKINLIKSLIILNTKPFFLRKKIINKIPLKKSKLVIYNKNGCLGEKDIYLPSQVKSMKKDIPIDFCQKYWFPSLALKLILKLNPIQKENLELPHNTDLTLGVKMYFKLEDQ